MERPPRNIATERLVSFPLLFYDYVTVGLIGEALVCTGAYLWTFTHNSVPLSDVWLIPGSKDCWLTIADNIGCPDSAFSAEEQERITREVRNDMQLSSHGFMLNTAVCDVQHRTMRILRTLCRAASPPHKLYDCHSCVGCLLVEHQLCRRRGAAYGSARWQPGNA
jgi:hypothetical protein